MKKRSVSGWLKCEIKNVPYIFFFSSAPALGGNLFIDFDVYFLIRDNKKYKTSKNKTSFQDIFFCLWRKYRFDFLMTLIKREILSNIPDQGLGFCIIHTVCIFFSIFWTFFLIFELFFDFFLHFLCMICLKSLPTGHIGWKCYKSG